MLEGQVVVYQQSRIRKWGFALTAYSGPAPEAQASPGPANR